MTVSDAQLWIPQQGCFTLAGGFGDSSISELELEADDSFNLMVDDLIATIPASWSWSRAVESIRQTGLALPHVAWHRPKGYQVLGGPQGYDAPLAWWVGLGLPQPFGESLGQWTDWLLEAEFLTADGARAKSGARVAKSVAGFDLHHLLISSTNTLFVPISFTFRLRPQSSVPQLKDIDASGALSIRLDDSPDGEREVVHCKEDPTWVLTSSLEPGSWPLTPSWQTPGILSESSRKWWRRAKETFDPVGRLWPKELPF